MLMAAQNEEHLKGLIRKGNGKEKKELQINEANKAYDHRNSS